MKLKYKFFISFLIVALLPLAIVGIVAFERAEQALVSSIFSGLEAVADVQEKRIDEALERYLEQAKSITSRTQLRISLNSYSDTNNPQDLDKIESIIRDAVESIPDITYLSILDLDGRVVASTNELDLGKDNSSEEFFQVGQKVHALHEIIKDKDNIAKAQLVGPLFLDAKLIGIAKITASLNPLIAVTEDYTGLGNSGEVILAKKNANGDAVFLTPLRFDSGAALTRAIPKERTEVPITLAMQGLEGTASSEETIDYRGEPVFAVTRFVESLNWALVVKIDQAEARSPIKSLQRGYILILLASILFVTVISFLMARNISRPIQALTLFARQLQEAKFEKRADLKVKGELGILAGTLNTMAAKIQASYSQLEQKVKERTSDLNKVKEELEKKLEETERLNKIMVDRELKMIELKEEIKVLKGDKGIAS